MGSLVQDIKSWIKRLSEPRPEFNGLPACPFSEMAKFHAVSEESIDRLEKRLLAYSSKKLLLIVNLPLGLANEVQAEVRRINWRLNEKGFIALVSDPRKPIVIRGFRTTQHDRLFVILQPLKELNEGAEKIRKHGYYDNWDKETLARVMEGR